jgi:hypothetical protein
MAITINTNPGVGSSLQDNLWHVATSTNAAVPDMKYIFEVYLNGSKKISVRQFPDPTNGKSYFDASGTIKSTMTYTWFEPLTTAYGYEPDVSGEVGQTYEIRVGEEVSGIATLNMASGITSVYNYTAPFFKRRVSGIGTMLNKWLTNRPLTINAQLGQNIYIPFYTDEILQLKVNTYDNSNTLVQTATGGNNNIDHGFVQMNIGSAAIATNLSVTINGNIKYYDVWFNSFDKVRVYLQCNPKYTPISIHFMNAFGMFETHSFSLASRLSMNVERKGFEQRDYRFNGNAVDYNSANNKYYEGKINYDNKADLTYKLTSDALADLEYKWLSELIMSPQILMEVDGYFYPVLVKANTYEFNTFVNDRLKALQIDFDMNMSRNSQLR